MRWRDSRFSTAEDACHVRRLHLAAETVAALLQQHADLLRVIAGRFAARAILPRDASTAPAVV